MIKKIFKLIFSEELSEIKVELEKSRKKRIEFESLISQFQVSVDVNTNTGSWAAISLQGKNADFIKFIHLGHSDIAEIHRFLKRFDRRNVDAAPHVRRMLKF